MNGTPFVHTQRLSTCEKPHMEGGKGRIIMCVHGMRVGSVGRKHV